MNRQAAYLAAGGFLATAVLGGIAFLAGCKTQDGQMPAARPAAQQAGTADTQAAAARTVEEGEATAVAQSRPPEDGVETDEQDAILEHALDAWTGDFDGMVERGFVRMLTTYNPLFLTYDGIERKGLAVEIARAFEEYLAKVTGKKTGAPHVVIIPVARDELLPNLLDGKGDIAAANLTITPARQELVSFSNPTYPDVSELVISGPAGPEVTSLDDLVSSAVHVRRSSSYFEHLSALNQSRKAAGQPEIPIIAADELLEDYDLLEMVNAGLIPAVIVDSHKAALWAQVFENIKVHENLSVHSGGSIAWAVRKQNSKLLETANGFIKTMKKGTLLGNVLLKRYVGSTNWIDNVRSRKAREKYEATVGIIKKYAANYDFDWLMITAQGYQESKLDQSKRSDAGAIGIMQLLPSTAADPNVGIPNVEKVEPNIHAGVKYLRFLRDRYFSSPDIDPLDQVLLAFAAYNAGPGNVSKARKRASRMGLDPNRWFGQVEIAAAKAISHEPVIYVRNIYKYYVAYKQIARLREGRDDSQGRQD
jgi:membrane-bound lytic murein transglycosylase MltF